MIKRRVDKIDLNSQISVVATPNGDLRRRVFAIAFNQLPCPSPLPLSTCAVNSRCFFEVFFFFCFHSIYRRNGGCPSASIVMRTTRDGEAPLRDCPGLGYDCFEKNRFHFSPVSFAHTSECRTAFCVVVRQRLGVKENEINPIRFAPAAAAAAETRCYFSSGNASNNPDHGRPPSQTRSECVKPARTISVRTRRGAVWCRRISKSAYSGPS